MRKWAAGAEEDDSYEILSFENTGIDASLLDIPEITTNLTMHSHSCIPNDYPPTPRRHLPSLCLQQSGECRS